MQIEGEINFKQSRHDGVSVPMSHHQNWSVDFVS